TTHTATGDVFLTDAGALTLGAITTTGGDVDVRTTAAGTLTAGGAISTGGGAVTLSSQDVLAVNGGITAGGGTVAVLANQDGTGAQGFSQQDATTIAGTGITITVNTGAGNGTGGAVVSDVTDAGALSITTDNTAQTAGGSITRTATSTLTGTSVSLTTGTGSIGTGTGANAINLAAGQTGVTATTHTATGDVFLTDAGALTLGAITTTGGDVDVRTTAAGTLT